MTLQELVAVWKELRDTGELVFCDLVDAVDEVVGITNPEGIKVRDLDPPNSPLSPEVWLNERLAELKENQQPNS